MSEHPNKLSVVNFGSRSRHLLGGDHQRGAGHHHCELNDQFIPALDAAIDADAISSSGFRLSDRGVEELRHAKPFNKVHFFRNQVHFVVPRQKDAREHHITNAEKVTEEFANDSRIRFRAASCTDSAQLDCDTCTNAASSRGELLTALVHAVSGAINRNFKSLSIQIANQYSAISIDALRSFCAFVAQQIHSCRSLLQLSVPAECAVLLSILPMRSSASDRGCF